MTAPGPARWSPTDSPWFWLLLFCAVGCIALAAAVPKYSRRQVEIENEYRARDPRFQSARRHVTHETVPPSTTRTLVPLAPLGLAGGAGVAISGIMLWREARAHRCLRE